MNSFYEMVEALKEIRELRLYKESHNTFDAYCQDKWSMKKDYANKMIGSSEVIDNLNTIVSVLPITESQVRPLTKLDPEQQQQAWQEVVKESNETHEPITAKKVEEAVYLSMISNCRPVCPK
jgi:hypothetical protein